MVYAAGPRRRRSWRQSRQDLLVGVASDASAPRYRVLSRPGSGDYRGSLRPRSRNEHRTPATSNVPPSPPERVAQLVRAPVLQTGGRWFDPSLAHSLVAVAQPVERPPETRGAAGSIPAGHTLASLAGSGLRPLPRAAAHAPASGPCTQHCPPRIRARSDAPGNREERMLPVACKSRPIPRGSVAQLGRAPGSYPGGCRFDACRGHLRKDCHGRGIPFRKRVGPQGPWGFDSLSFLLSLP
jgi:hypothetical protein